MQYRNIIDARKGALRQGEDLTENTQFPIKFKDTTIFMQPEKMEQSNGLPVLNAEKYIAQHHPERLQEFREARQRTNEKLNYLDSLLGSSYPFK